MGSFLNSSRTVPRLSGLSSAASATASVRSQTHYHTASRDRIYGVGDEAGGHLVLHALSLSIAPRLGDGLQLVGRRCLAFSRRSRIASLSAVASSCRFRAG